MNCIPKLYCKLITWKWHIQLVGFLPEKYNKKNLKKKKRQKKGGR